jgi:hypothetical protein
MGVFGLWAIECQRASGTSLYGSSEAGWGELAIAWGR